jgi:hypothetical protein
MPVFFALNLVPRGTQIMWLTIALAVIWGTVLVAWLITEAMKRG